MKRKFSSAISLRIKITAAFILIVIGGTTVSTLIGSLIVTTAMLNQARSRVYCGLEAARIIYDEKLNDINRMIEYATFTKRVMEAAGSEAFDRFPKLLSTLRKEKHLDFLSFVDREGRLAIHASESGMDTPSAVRMPVRDLIKTAMSGKVASGTEIADKEFLLEENPALVNAAYITGKPPPDPNMDTRKDVGSGLVLVAAAPIRNESGIAGFIYGGILLDRNHAIVDQIKRIIYGDEKYGDRDVGTVSIFMRNVEVSSSVKKRSGKRALETRISGEVAKKVLSRGERWRGRALVADDWYLAVSEPIRSHSGGIIGALYVRLLERPFLTVRTDMMLTFVVVAAVGVMIVLGLTYLITRNMILPLEELVAAAKRIAGGDMDHSVKVHSKDEIGYLAVNFNKMQISLKAMKRELQQWGHTLEKKVDERTRELKAMQAQVVQAEKMASLGRLAAGVAHEINNPLSGIMAFSMLSLEDCDADHPMRENLEAISEQTLRCRGIVKGLLDFSRQSESSASLTDINTVVDSTLSMVDRQTIFHNIRTVRKFRENIASILIDQYQLQQVIINMVLNAADAMDDSGTLTIETGMDEETDMIFIRISDTGKGIPDKVIPFIFEPFFTTKKVGQGTGLGLAIAHGIVNRAGGRIDVRSSNSGAAFTIWLPVARQDEKDKADEKA